MRSLSLWPPETATYLIKEKPSRTRTFSLSVTYMTVEDPVPYPFPWALNLTTATDERGGAAIVGLGSMDDHIPRNVTAFWTGSSVVSVTDRPE